MRRNEVLALRWENVDLDGRVIRVREAIEETKENGIRVKAPKSKAGKRDVSLPEIVVAALRDYRRQQLELRMALGAADHGRLHLADGVLSALGAHGRSDRFPDVTFHALRHTHASQLIDAGVDVVMISKRLGHASPSLTLRVYAHMWRKDDSRAAAAIDAALGGR